MAYATPLPDYVVQLGGTHEAVQGLEEADFYRHLQLYLSLAENMVALEMKVDSLAGETWTTAQANVAQAAVAYVGLGLFYLAVAGGKVAGINEPLLMEEARELREHATALQAQGMQMAGIVSTDDELAGPGEIEFGSITSTELLDYAHPAWLGETDVEVR